MHTFDFIIYGLAIAVTIAAYLRDPGLPAVGLRAGFQLFLDVLPRLLAALEPHGRVARVQRAQESGHRVLRGDAGALVRRQDGRVGAPRVERREVARGDDDRDQRAHVSSLMGGGGPGRARS